jgi:hypothetical protein
MTDVNASNKRKEGSVTKGRKRKKVGLQEERRKRKKGGKGREDSVT